MDLADITDGINVEELIHLVSENRNLRFDTFLKYTNLNQCRQCQVFFCQGLPLEFLRVTMPNDLCYHHLIDIAETAEFGFLSKALDKIAELLVRALDNALEVVDVQVLVCRRVELSI